MGDRILDISSRALEASDSGVRSMVNNIVNAQTPGYKKTGVVVHSFSSHLEKASNALESRVSEGAVYPKISGEYRSPVQGPLYKTGAKLDVAIGGNSFFVVQGPEGEVYTRDGRFHLDENGSLVTTSGGYQVMGIGGPIMVIPGSKVEIKNDGTILVDSVQSDKLRLVLFDKPENLDSFNGTFFRFPETGGVSITEEQNPRVLQGFLESSNVNIMEEMMNMIYLERTFATVSKLVLTRDTTMSRALEMGRPAQ